MVQTKRRSCVDLPQSYCRWAPGNEVSLISGQEECLTEFHSAGFVPFTGPAYSIGARSSTRSVLIIHRGRSRRWEIVFSQLIEESDSPSSEVASCFTDDLVATKNAAIRWLRNEAIEDVQKGLSGNIIGSPSWVKGR